MPLRPDRRGDLSPSHAARSAGGRRVSGLSISSQPYFRDLSGAEQVCARTDVSPPTHTPPPRLSSPPPRFTPPTGRRERSQAQRTVRSARSKPSGRGTLERPGAQRRCRPIAAAHAFSLPPCARGSARRERGALTWTPMKTVSASAGKESGAGGGCATIATASEACASVRCPISIECGTDGTTPTLSSCMSISVSNTPAPKPTATASRDGATRRGAPAMRAMREARRHATRGAAERKETQTRAGKRRELAPRRLRRARRAGSGNSTPAVARARQAWHPRRAGGRRGSREGGTVATA